MGTRALPLLMSALVLVACSDDPDGERGSAGSGSTPTAGRSGSGSGVGGDDFSNAPRAGSGAMGGTGRAGAGAAGASGQAACATERAGAELEPVYLAFAFDVSGSMGKGDEEWHDKTLKWDPVVAATRSFFEDSGSDGLTASLTFFPADGDEDQRCVVESYADPDVAMTALPSEAFGDAIDAIEPQDADDWRGGTPTKFVVAGTVGFVLAEREQHPGRYAIVLVTDGYPQGCDDADDEISAVVAEVEAALDEEITTYVIGVANPPIDGAPDTVSDLQGIAEAGGTQRAFLIDTGDPDATAGAFTAAVDEIRGTAIACNLAIPKPPGGRTFDKEKVAVRYTSGAGDERVLVYDPDCSADDTWHYDDPAAPTEIVLCDAACGSVQADPGAELEVEFACERLLTVD
jgi:hypothetical protein